MNDFKKITSMVKDLEARRDEPVLFFGHVLPPAPKTAYEEFLESGLTWDEWVEAGDSK